MLGSYKDQLWSADEQNLNCKWLSVIIFRFPVKGHLTAVTYLPASAAALHMSWSICLLWGVSAAGWSSYISTGPQQWIKAALCQVGNFNVWHRWLALIARQIRDPIWWWNRLCCSVGVSGPRKGISCYSRRWTARQQSLIAFGKRWQWWVSSASTLPLCG